MAIFGDILSIWLCIFFISNSAWVMIVPFKVSVMMDCEIRLNKFPICASCFDSGDLYYECAQCTAAHEVHTSMHR